jgi:O-succinylbenzoate synthase
MALPDPRLADLGIDRAEPFRVATTTRFRGVTHRDGWLLRGPVGWAEFSPFPEYPPAVAARWLRAAVAAATVPPPPAVRGVVEVNVTVPAVAPADAAARVRTAACRTAKVKVAEPGQELAADEARVAAVRAALGPDGRIRVDANAAWDVPTAAHALARLDAAAAGLEYAEQPCRTLDELRDLRGRTRVPLAADESLRTAADPFAAARAAAGAVDLVVLKVQPLGGVADALRLADAAGLPAVVSSALETSVGLAVGLELALALPSLAGACGLGTASLLAEDVVDDPLRPASGRLRARPRPGLSSIPGPSDAADLADLRARLVAALDATPA